jgi:hypothetical protein
MDDLIRQRWILPKDRAALRQRRITSLKREPLGEGAIGSSLPSFINPVFLLAGVYVLSESQVLMAPPTSHLQSTGQQKASGIARFLSLDLIGTRWKKRHGGSLGKASIALLELKGVSPLDG